MNVSTDVSVGHNGSTNFSRLPVTAKSQQLSILLKLREASHFFSETKLFILCIDQLTGIFLPMVSALPTTASKSPAEQHSTVALKFRRQWSGRVISDPRAPSTMWVLDSTSHPLMRHPLKVDDHLLPYDKSLPSLIHLTANEHEPNVFYLHPYSSSPTHSAADSGAQFTNLQRSPFGLADYARGL